MNSGDSTTENACMSPITKFMIRSFTCCCDRSATLLLVHEVKVFCFFATGSGNPFDEVTDLFSV
ncbi:hypothetical protein Bpfe_005271, partial [Biomphalaria pfeifferi]